MTRIDDGGPAYPGRKREFASDGTYLRECPVPGKSLRDWFAGLAMWGFLSRMDGPWTEAPEHAYRVADAMLAVRGKPTRNEE